MLVRVSMDTSLDTNAWIPASDQSERCPRTSFELAELCLLMPAGTVLLQSEGKEWCAKKTYRFRAYHVAYRSLRTS